MKAPLPPNESERLATLRRYHVLDTPPEASFDDLTKLAAYICNAPIALISLVDDDRQWFKSKVGVSKSEFPRDWAFCAYAILQPELFVVEDATRDERFASNPLVTGEPRIRFYLGAPLIAPDGNAIGTLCVIDRVPRQLSSEQHLALRVLSNQVIAQMEMRKQFDAMERSRSSLLGILEDQTREARQFELILSSTGEGIYGVDLNSCCTFINRAAERLLGYQSQECLDRDMHALVHHHKLDGAPYPRSECPVVRASEKGEDVHVDSEVYWRQDGTSFPVDYSAHPIFENGVVTGTVVTFSDITERKRLEDQLRQTEKMNAIGQLAGGVAHDFNNQLNAIMGYAALLKEDVTDEKLNRYVKGIIVAAQRSADLTKKLLAFSRKGQFQTTPLSIHQILADTKEMLERSIDKRIEIKTALNAEADVILGDPSQIQNAFLNLAVNARDAMPNGGILAFETKTMFMNPNAIPKHAGEADAGEYIKICVTDSGTGMTNEVKQHLFEPFFTTKPVGKGTGMGLASVFGTVKNHKGLIDVYSEVGRGSTFKIYLPLERSREAGKSSLMAAVKMTGRYRILLAEDEEILRIMFSEMLQAHGHEIIQAPNGREAVDIYLKEWKHIDLVILDMVMPELDGPDAFRAMKKINPKIKALLATGYSLNNEVQGALDSGVLDFIQKPFMPNDLFSLIARIMKEEKIS